MGMPKPKITSYLCKVCINSDFIESSEFIGQKVIKLGNYKNSLQKIVNTFFCYIELY